MSRLRILTLIFPALLIAGPAWAGIVVHKDGSGNPATCTETTDNIFNIGTPNAAIAVGDLLVLTMSGVGDLDSSSLLSGITAPAGVGPFQFAKSISAVYDPHGGGRSYIAYAKTTAAFTDGVGITVTANKTTFMGGCLYDVSGLAGILDAQAAIEISNTALSANATPVVVNSIAAEFGVMIDSCQNTIGSSPVNSPWISAGINGAGGCPAGYLVTARPGLLLQAVGNQSGPGSAATGIALFR